MCRRILWNSAHEVNLPNGCNHVFQIFSQSVHGLQSCDAPKIALSIDLLRRPYNRTLTAVRHCDSNGWRYRQTSFLLSRPVSPIILVYLRQAHVPNSNGVPSAGALNKRGWEMFAVFDWNCRLSRKWYEVGPWLLWNVNRKPQVADRSVTVSVTLSDLERRDAMGQIFFRQISFITISDPQFSGFPSILAYTLCRRNAISDVVTHMGRGLLLRG